MSKTCVAKPGLSFAIFAMGSGPHIPVVNSQGGVPVLPTVGWCPPGPVERSQPSARTCRAPKPTETRGAPPKHRAPSFSRETPQRTCPVWPGMPTSTKKRKLLSENQLSHLDAELHSPFPHDTGTWRVRDTDFPHPRAEDSESRHCVLRGHMQQLRLLATTIKTTKLRAKPWPRSSTGPGLSCPQPGTSGFHSCIFGSTVGFLTGTLTLLGKRGMGTRVLRCLPELAASQDPAPERQPGLGTLNRTPKCFFPGNALVTGAVPGRG
ncbi:uncharacterized protein LOC134526502 [Chroicocephalus ridibundus]|uniref:uncharacterized protein LOC134526502 n=1 Tax=Chroicocephalus ridibundus TaxID=1192867 RepID=UPI002FDD6268